MSDVIQLSDYRHHQDPTPCCPRHGLLDLVDRIRSRLDDADALLVSVDVLADVLADVEATTDALTLPTRQDTEAGPR